MRFAERNGLVVAAAAHVMALVVIGNRVIALIHLQTAESHEIQHRRVQHCTMLPQESWSASLP